MSYVVVQVGNTSLQLAAYHGFSQTLQLLIGHRANVYLTNKVTFTLTFTNALTFSLMIILED